MTAPLSYLLGDNPTNTHYCLLCAQEECADASGLHKVAGWMGKRLLDCPRCDGTGSKLVPIAEHPVDHEHVKATVRAMQGWWIKEQDGVLVFGNEFSGLETSEAWLSGNTKAPYWETKFAKLSTRPLTKADLWDMAVAVAEKDCWEYDSDRQREIGPFWVIERVGDLDESVTWAFIAQEYETRKERVKE